MGVPVHSEIIIMKAFIFTTVLAAAAVPLEDTVEVKVAKAEFSKAFARAQAGKHAELAPSPTYLADLPEVAQARDEFRAVWDMYAAGEAQPVATNYIADTPEVADAKDAFRAVYDMYAAGDVAKPVAPIHKVTPAVAPVAYTTKAVAPVHADATYWNNYYGAYPTAYAGYPYYTHNIYPYAHTAYPYAHAGYYGTYPYAFPAVTIKAAKAE